MTAAQPIDVAALLVSLVGTASYLAFHYGLEQRVRPAATPSDNAAVMRAVERQRYGGALLLGVLPGVALLVWLRAAGLAWPDHLWGWGLPYPARSALATLGLLALTLPAVLISARKPDFRNHYPQARLAGEAAWTPALQRRNRLSWGVYLLGYEAFFRGWLLFVLVDAVGLWLALGWMTTLYVAVHLTKNAQEAAACLPMGFVFGGVALWTGSFWAPMLAHACIAITAETLATRPSPQRA